MKIFALLLVIFPLVCITPAAGECFKPWDAAVAVGDEGLADAVPGAPQAGSGYGRGVYDAVRGGAILLIRIFQIWISPQDGPNCRFRPVCSAYGKIAVERYGAFLGGVLAGDRILRCNPFSKPGDDPVPDSLEK
ncbi:MAG: membrane protein insertion efficiency factor YidD [Spirochaetes bacterium]|nr:membrane protein insertion efficiency factor YidD [Spirochaetota bacterium]